MKILKIFFIGLAAFCLMVAVVGCPNGTEGSGTVDVITNNDGTKITSLKAVLESDDIKDGSIIDLSLAKYKSITDFNAVVNKSVTIMSGSDFKGGELKIVADGVVLDNINNASVSTQASLKISGSTLNDLNIVEIDSSAANANEVIGRGVDRWWFDMSKPIVTTRKKTRIKKKVKVSIPETVLTINDSEAAKIEISGENAQVTVEGTDTKIDAIETDTVCQVVLEDGTSDNIATPVVTSAEGELTQINMQAAGGMKLLKLTPSSGLETIVAKGESIDFSKVAVLGTYQSVDGVTLFKAGGLSYNHLTETFSKLESDFIITIDGAAVYKNGAPVKTFSWAGLDAGKYTAYIDKDYDDTEDGYKYKFDITVTDAGTNVSDLTFQLTEISVQSDNAKTTYLVGDKLNLRGIVVLGTYKAGTIEYTGIISDYTLSVENGTVLSAAGKQDITITAGDKTGKVEITVNVPTVTQVKVTFVVDKDDPSKNSTRSIDKDTVITAPSMSKPDWTFDGWFTSPEYKTLYDFSTPVTADLTLYAKWTKNEGTDPIDPTDESDDTNQPAPNKPVDTSMTAPTNVQVTECTQVPNSVNVTWTATGEQVYYYVFYSKSNDPATAVVAKWYGMATGTTSNAISSIVLPSSGTYYFWVAAADAQFYSQVTKRSEFSSAKTYQFTYTQLDAPINVSITKSDVTNCVKVTCEPTETANYYWVYVAAENDLSKAKIRGMLYKSEPYIDIALTANGTYYFWLRGDGQPDYVWGDDERPLGYKPSANAGAFSNAASYTFNKWTKLDAPTAINAIPSTTNKVKVVWSGSETITYWVYYGTSNDSSKATLCRDVDIRQFSQDNGYGGHTEMSGYRQAEILLSDTAKYYFWVRTDNNVIEDYSKMFERNPSPNASDFSPAAEYDFTYTAMVAPTDVSVKQISSKRATVSWTPNGAPYYGIFISKTNDVNTAEYISYEYGYDYEVQSDTIILPAYGVHYIWVGASDDDAFRDGDRARIVFGQSVSVDFKNEPMAAPTGLKAELYEYNDECVTLSCETEAPFCWIYMSTTDRTADAQYVQSYPSVFQSCNVNLSDKSAGTYYFWIKAADGQDPDFSDGAYPDSSDFSAAVSYEYKAWTIEDVNEILIYDNDNNVSRTSLTIADSDYPAGEYIFDLSRDTYDRTIRFAFGISGNTTSVWNSNYSYHILTVNNPVEAQKNDSYQFSFTGTAGHTYKITWWVYEGVGNVIVTEVENTTPQQTLDTPTNVTAAKGSDDNKVSLTWDAVGGATEYLVYYSTDDERPNNYTSYTTNSCEIELPGTGVYSFWIQAVHSDNGTVTSSSLYGTATYNYESTTTSGFNLQVTSDLSAQSYPSDNKVCLTWNAVSGAAYYNVYISNQLGYINATLQMGWISSQEEYLNHDVYLTEDGHYYFWVTSVEGYGDQGEAINESEPSNMAEIEFTYTPLKQPTNVQVTADENRKNHVQLSWGYDGTHEPFFVYYSTENDVDTATYYDTAVSGSVGSGNGVYLKASGTYYFWVCAGNDPYNSYDHGPFSEAVSYNHTYQELVAPTVTLTNNGTNVTISWGEPTANYYWIYKGISDEISEAERENPPADCTWQKLSSYTLNVESPGTYYFWVRAADTEYDANYPEQIQSNLSGLSTIQSIVIP